MARPYAPRGGTLIERFWRHVRKTDTCWIWMRSRTEDGYGRLCVGPGGSVIEHRTHRLSWEIHNGPIPDGLSVLHRCDNPPCCNPAHLFLGTTLDNVRDAVAKGRHMGSATHCPKGHPYAPENTRRHKGGRICIACMRAASRAHYLRNRSLKNDNDITPDQ